ncbi:MAG: MoaD/ThiS family protein [Thaumarchaeota archaeon]|nr:MoaD/ThiS family protein [Nitrososphaerota archaeon]
MARIRVIYFAQAREAAGKHSEVVDFAGTPRVSEALLLVYAIHPGLRTLQKVVKVAVNAEVTLEDPYLQDGDRVALLPPVVGG